MPLTHDKVAPAHHEAAGAHVHVAPRLQQTNVFLQDRRNGNFNSGQCSLVTCRSVPEEEFGLQHQSTILVAPLAPVLTQIPLFQLKSWFPLPQSPLGAQRGKTFHTYFWETTCSEELQ